MKKMLFIFLMLAISSAGFSFTTPERPKSEHFSSKIIIRVPISGSIIIPLSGGCTMVVTITGFMDVNITGPKNVEIVGAGLTNVLITGSCKRGGEQKAIDATILFSPDEITDIELSKTNDPEIIDLFANSSNKATIIAWMNSFIPEK